MFQRYTSSICYMRRQNGNNYQGKNAQVLPRRLHDGRIEIKKTLESGNAGS